MPLHVDWATEPVPDLSQYSTYEEAYAAFEWDIPATYNVGRNVMTRHADGSNRVALYQESETGDVTEYTFEELERRANAIARGLKAKGITKGDRIGIVSSQRVETPLLHIAGFKLGAVTVPLSVLYGPEALEYRLASSEAEIIFAEPSVYEQVQEAVGTVDAVDRFVGLGDAPAVPSGVASETLAEFKQGGGFEPVETAATDPAILVYSSGTTGYPKGILLSHESLVGLLPGVQMMYELPWHADDPVLYTPADWAWAGGLCDVVLPAWHYGIPTVGYHSTSGFDPGIVMRLFDEYDVTASFMTPTMFEMIAQADDVDAAAFDVSALQAIMVGGEPFRQQIHDWAVETFDAALNEIWGQTETNLMTSNCSQWFPATPPGCIGKPIPGHEVDVIDEEGVVLPEGEVGRLAVKTPDPTVMLEYWDDPELTDESYVDDWIVSGDYGYKQDGFLWFESRADEVIITSGYRVGPDEVEDGLLRHEAVRNAGVVGVEDETRGKIVKAFIELEDGVTPSDEVKSDIQAFVRERLAKYEYPREIEFISEIPITTTGKIQRSKLEEIHDAA